MKIKLISAAIYLAISSNQVIANSNQDMVDSVSGSARFNFETSELIIPCVLINAPGDPLDGKFFDATLDQGDGSLNFRVTLADEELDAEACRAAAEVLLQEDMDTIDDGEYSSKRDDMEMNGEDSMSRNEDSEMDDDGRAPEDDGSRERVMTQPGL